MSLESATENVEYAYENEITNVYCKKKERDILLHFGWLVWDRSKNIFFRLKAQLVEIRTF